MDVRRAARLIVAALVLAAPATRWHDARLLAASPDTAPPLPAPTGAVVDVSTVAQLENAVAQVASGTTIRIAPGTYALTTTLFINKSVSDVVIRGATNNRNDVVLVGPGMANTNYGNVPYGIWTGGGVTRLTIANLTIRDVYYHPIIFNAGTQQPRVYNVRLLDGGEQLLKSNPDGAGGGVDSGVVEYSVFEFTSVARSDYTNAVDVHTGDNWIIRHNLFRRIRSAVGLAGPAVLMWNDSRGTLVEANTFVDNHRDISLGLITRTPNDHTGGIVRNNMIARSAGAGGDVGIGVFDSPGTKVVHNTIRLNGAYPNAIEYRFADTTGVVIANNLTDAAITARDGASASLAGNVTTATASDFVAPTTGDLHLTATATRALDKVTAHADAGTDWDGNSRPSGTLADVGADERITVSTPPPVEICGNGIDDDGDGLVDEGCPPPPPPPVEICGNGIDDDGDGLIDEGCTPPPPPPVEICGNGIDDDGDGLIDEGCPPPPPPPVEVCGNGIDDDGDGLIDEGCTPPPPPPVELCGNGVDDDGDGLVDEGCTTPPAATVPGAPTRLVGHVQGRTVSLSWLAPIDGGAVTRYVLEAGLSAGATLVRLPLGARTDAMLPGVGAGTYYLRVRAEGTGGVGAASNEIAIAVGTCAATAAPRGLTASANGSRVTLTWSDDAPCEGRPYHLVVGSRSGVGDLGMVPVSASPFEVVVPPGTYFVRVAGPSGAPSNEVRLVGGAACTAPALTLALSGRSTGGRVDLTWAPADPALAATADAATPISYVLEAGATPGGAEFGVLPLGRVTAFASAAPAGRYHLRVRAVNACGAGPASNDVVLTVP